MVVRAAVIVYDHKQRKEITIPCHRHCDAFQILKEFGYRNVADYKEIAQGFLNERGEFLSRADAWQEAKRCNQFLDTYIEEHIEDIVPPTILYSEDIW